MRGVVCRLRPPLMLAVAVAGGLAGCSLPEPKINWAEPKPGAGSAIAQCYRTLADPDCSRVELPDQAHRAVGWFDTGPSQASAPEAQ